MVGLAEFLVFPLFLVFARVGAAFFVFPALSDVSISPRIRLLAALAVSVVMFPVLKVALPTMPESSNLLLLMLGAELVIGLLMGLGARLFMAALNVAGELISFMAGFQAATLFDPQSGSSTAAPTVLLTLTAGLIVLATGLHHELIRALAASYATFPAGQLPPVEDVTAAVVDIFAHMFALGTQLAAPVVVAGLLANALFGVMNRLIPQLQVFFVSVPVSITLSLLVLAAGMSTMMQLWITATQARMSIFQAEGEAL